MARPPAADLAVTAPRLQPLLDALDNLRQQQIDIATFCHVWRSRQDLLTSLPARFEQVAEDLLSRLEAGSLFTEESCSFSQGDLLHHLALWLDKAAQALASPPSTCSTK